MQTSLHSNTLDAATAPASASDGATVNVHVPSHKASLVSAPTHPVPGLASAGVEGNLSDLKSAVHAPAPPEAEPASKPGRDHAPLCPINAGSLLEGVHVDGQGSVQKDHNILHLYNVPLTATNDSLVQVCSFWGGEVLSVSRKVSKVDPETVEVVASYASKQQAEDACHRLDGLHVLGRKLQAQLHPAVLQRHLKSFQKGFSSKDQVQHAAGGARNLYVLNLSLDMTTEELEHLFSVCGEVVHVCILAVLDSQGRRRAFVDMATGEAARKAIHSLSGAFIHGYRLDVSFAIVQRSGGPVTDYPATAKKRAQQASFHTNAHPHASASAYIRNQMQIQQVVPAQISQGHLPAPPVAAFPQHLYSAPLGPSPISGTVNSLNYPYRDTVSAPAVCKQAPTETAAKRSAPYNLELYQEYEICISNLDPVVFFDEEALANVFRPFGNVRASLLLRGPIGQYLGAGLVRMSNGVEAEEARINLHGIVVGSRRIFVTHCMAIGSPDLQTNMALVPQPFHVPSPMPSFLFEDNAPALHEGFGLGRPLLPFSTQPGPDMRLNYNAYPLPSFQVPVTEMLPPGAHSYGSGLYNGGAQPQISSQTQHQTTKTRETPRIKPEPLQHSTPTKSPVHSSEGSSLEISLGDSSGSGFRVDKPSTNGSTDASSATGTNQHDNTSLMVPMQMVNGVLVADGKTLLTRSAPASSKSKPYKPLESDVLRALFISKDGKSSDLKWS